MFFYFIFFKIELKNAFEKNKVFEKIQKTFLKFRKVICNIYKSLLAFFKERLDK